MDMNCHSSENWRFDSKDASGSKQMQIANYRSYPCNKKALELAYQSTWTTIEVWMHNSEVIMLLSKEDDQPIETSPIL